jgi:hypothetical protein
MGEQPVAKPLPTHRTTQTQNKSTQTSMPRVGFEPTTPVFERAKIIHALDREASVKHGENPKEIFLLYVTRDLKGHTYHEIPSKNLWFYTL